MREEPETATRAIVNANVRVMDAADRRVDALAWRDGRLISIGSRSDVLREAGDDAIIHDADGASVLPGFIDPHHHAGMVALYGAQLKLSAPRVTDIASLQEALATAAAELAPDEWLVATQWDELRLTERRPPTRAELDDAVPDRPLVAFQYSFHRAIANSRALELASIDRHTPNPSGGSIERGPDGVPNGLLIERGMSRVEALARSNLLTNHAEAFFARLERHHRAIVASGITRIADATVPVDMVRLYREADRRGHLTVPTVIMPVSTTGYLETPWDALDGPVTGEREGLLQFGPLKLVFDGAPGCAMCLSWWQSAGVTVNTWKISAQLRSFDPVRTAFSLAPRIGHKIQTGIHIYEQQEARAIVDAAVDRGFALAIHAIGNDAVDHALSTLESAGSTRDAAGRPRLEHATFLSPGLVDRIANIGAAVVAQPHFLSLPAFGSAPSVPGLKNSALRWLLDRDVLVAGSSDHPVAGFDPLDGIRSAVTRRTEHGVLDRDQAVGITEALTMYTRSGAEVCGCADECGSLEVGKRADLAILNTALNESSLAHAQVSATVIDGRTVFGALE